MMIDPIYNNEKSQVIAWIVLQTNRTNLKLLLATFQKQLSDLNYSNSTVLLFDEQTNILFPKKEKQFKFTNKINQFQLEQSIFVNSRAIQTIPAYLALLVPSSDINKDLHQAIYTSFAITSVIFLVLFFLMFGLLKSLVINPILLLTQSSDQMKEGKLDQKINLYSNDEIGTLARSFEEMAQSVQSGIDSLENKVEERTLQLKDQNLKLQSLMDILSHDLKNPIGAIQGLSSLLMKNNDQQNHKEILTIHQTSTRILNLVDDLLGANTITNAKMKFCLEKSPLAPLIQNTFLENQTLAHHKNIQLEIEWNGIDEIKETFLMIDAQRILQILNNLISNALKLSHSGEAITIFIQKQDTQLTIGIKDLGIGIENDDLTRLISMKQKTTTLGTQQEQGTGLGLPLVQELLELHHSKLEYQALNPGSFFFFHLQVDG
ncbi:HAMP domain-containing histidine kinase [bacterium]|nr:HAMP domain-containing histidine kinase [bacterium]